MARNRSLIPWGWLPAGLLASTWMLPGCSFQKRVEPASIANSSLGSMTIAVAPALNLSGSADFDPDRFADLLASELSYAEGISVIPVSRVLAVLAAQGRSGVESPAHALELVGLLGADAILVFAVTEYDPYAPPSIGLSAQLFGKQPGTSGKPPSQRVVRKQRQSDSLPKPKACLTRPTRAWSVTSERSPRAGVPTRVPTDGASMLSASSTSFGTAATQLSGCC